MRQIQADMGTGGSAVGHPLYRLQRRFGGNARFDTERASRTAWRTDLPATPRALPSGCQSCVGAARGGSKPQAAGAARTPALPPANTRNVLGRLPRSPTPRLCRVRLGGVTAWQIVLAPPRGAASCALAPALCSAASGASIQAAVRSRLRPALRSL